MALGNEPFDLGNDPTSGGDTATVAVFSAPLAFTSDPSWFLPSDDYDIIRDLSGVSEDDWPDTRIQELPFLPLALAEARQRVPCDWQALGDDSRQYLRLALQYSAAARLVEAANPQRADDFKFGDFALKTDDALLLADRTDLLGFAALYFAQVVLPTGVVPVAARDPFPRRVMGRASVCGVGPGRLW